MKTSASLLALFCIAAFAQQKGTFTDTRDGKTYKTTKYGRLYDWATAMGIDKEFNKKKWNGSYVKHQGVCPKGWHLPSNTEWDRLMIAVGGIRGDGAYWKATSGWDDFENWHKKIIPGNGEDMFGFSALPGGEGWNDSGIIRFSEIGKSAYWWAAWQYDKDNANLHGIYHYDNYSVYYVEYPKSYFSSVRCVGD
jgi:uncharacterized protein (TIGR02145 family)